MFQLYGDCHNISECAVNRRVNTLLKSCLVHVMDITKGTVILVSCHGAPSALSNELGSLCVRVLWLYSLS